jgi:hypothetical protein
VEIVRLAKAGSAHGTTGLAKMRLAARNEAAISASNAAENSPESASAAK